MDWPNETVLEFLDWYENEPVIWNSAIPNHKNRDEVYDAWKRIELNMGQTYSITELKKKKESLMASYRTCSNKVKQSIKSGADGEDVYKPQWFAFEKMAGFLQDKDKSRNTMTTQDILCEESCEQDEPEEEDIASIKSEFEGIDPLILPPGRKSGIRNTVRKKRKLVDIEELKDKTDNSYAMPQPIVNTPGIDKKVCTLYGELLAAKLQSMDERTRDICMHRIDNIVFEMKTNLPANNYH